MIQEKGSRTRLMVLLMAALCPAPWVGFQAAAEVMPLRIDSGKVSSQKTFVALPEPVQKEMLRIYATLNSPFLAARAYAGGLSMDLMGGGLIGASLGQVLTILNKEKGKVREVSAFGLGGLLAAFKYRDGSYSHRVVQNVLADEVKRDELSDPEDIGLGSLLPADHAMSQRVRRVAEKLAPIANAWAHPATKLDWRVAVIEDQSWNAWCHPGGLIAVYTGMLEEIKSDDELAAAIGHEMAHAILHHRGQEVVEQRTSWLERGAGSFFRLGLGLIGSTNLVDIPKWGQALFNVMVRVTQRDHRSQTMECEADFVGTIMMWQAGYAPNVIPTMWARQAAMDQDENTGYVSSHPKSMERSKKLEVWVKHLESVSRG